MSRANLIKQIKASSFARNVITLASGAAGGQLLGIIAIPILTRLYSPGDFGLMGSLFSLMTMFSIIGSLRLEQAVPLPNEEKDAHGIISLSMVLLFLVTAIFASLLFLPRAILAHLVGSDDLVPWLWMLPFGVFAIGAYNIANMAAVRLRHFKEIAKTSLAQMVVQVLAQVALYFTGTLGLLGGLVVGRFAGTGTLFRFSVLPILRRHQFEKPRDLRDIFVRYKQFPLVSSWAALLNSAGLLLPPLLLNSCYGKDVAGNFVLGLRVIGAPMMFVGAAVAQVYVAEAVTAMNEGDGKLWRLHQRISKQVFLASFLILPIGLTAPWLFPLIFGLKYKASGIFVLITTLPLMGQMLVSPISTITTVTERLAWQLMGDTTRVLMVILSIYVPYHLHLPAVAAVGTYAVAMTITYAGFYYMYRECARRGSAVPSKQAVANGI